MRHKCHYFVAVSTVILVVLSTMVVQTMVDRGPVIFLRMAQLQHGEIDTFLTPISSGSGQFINFTGLEEAMGG